MHFFTEKTPWKKLPHGRGPLRRSQRGNILVYIVVVMLIFGLLGVAMVSLFTSASTSSATPNYARRARYMFESGMRYAMSELLNSGFATGVINGLNSTTYTVNPAGTFTLNVFGPWFDAGADVDQSGGGTLALDVPEGKIPEGFAIPNGLWIVNYDYLAANTNLTTTRDPVSGYSATAGNTTLTIDTTGDFVAAQGDRICLAVKPSENSQTLTDGGNLYVQEMAKDFFPATYGAININRRDYVYERLVDEPGNNRARLENITTAGIPNTLTPFPLNVTNPDDSPYTGDFIVLSPRNHIVVPTGTSGTVTVAGSLQNARNLYDHSLIKTQSRKADIEFAQESNLTNALSQVETGGSVISVDNSAKTLTLAGGGVSQPEFGGSWYKADKNIGGTRNFCQAGACLFDLGVRVFFTLDYQGDGPGLTFALVNAADNDISSIGGDVELSELLGYAGDSRLDAAGTTFLDGTGNGLRPPKMALEFDTRTDNANFQYCADASTVNLHTRKDPLSGNKDAVQYVYWGNTSLDIACRGNNPTYDDNRHDAEGPHEENPWQDNGLGGYFPGNGDIRSRPIVISDDVVYVTTDNGRLHAIDLKTGTERWTFPDADPTVPVIGKETTWPAISDDGSTIYFGSWNIDDPINNPNNRVWAINTSDGTKKWVFPDSDPAVASIGKVTESAPAVDQSGVIYIGSSDNNFYAINPDGTQKWVYTATDDVESDPIVDRTGGTYDGTIYVGQDGGRILAFDPAGGGIPKWAFIVSSDMETAPVLSQDGSIVYAVDESGKLWAIDASNGAPMWGSPVDLGRASHDNNPVVDLTGGSFDGTIYHVTDDGHLFAVKADGSGTKWDKYLNDTVHSSPAVGLDSTIYVGSDDHKLYAINPADGSVKWTRDTSAPVRSSPAVGPDGTVYFGNEDDKVFAINRVALPQNRRDLYITSTHDGANDKVGGEIVSLDNSDDWLKGAALKGPWAVRLEVLRGAIPNNGNYEYTLHTWLRQCSELDCSDVAGTFFDDTRVEYDAKIPHLAQTIELSPADHAKFDRFLFGFTTAGEAGDTQSTLISFFQLSFIRPGDPVVTSDPDWP